MILITRPRLEAEELKSKLLDLKINVHCDSLISFDYDNAWVKKENVLSINTVCLITSVQAVLSIEKIHSLNHYFQNVQIICVGERVSKYLKNKSVGNILKTFRDSNQLLSEFDFKKFKKNHFVYLCGNNYNVHLLEQIKSEGINCKPLIVYHVKTSSELKEETRELIEKNEINCVALYSQFSANIFIELLKKASLAESFRNKKIFCLSKKIELIVRSSHFNNVCVSPLPEEKSMIDVIKKSLLV